MARYGMVIDLERCMGCRACMEACKVENNTPQAIFWMYVFRFEEGEFPHVREGYIPRPCMHCENPPCVKACNACPAKARYKREDGLVLTDYDRCIGCRYCVAACPYGVNYFNWKEPKENYYIKWDAPEAAKALERVTGGAMPPYKNPDLDRKYGKEQRLVAGGGHRKGIVEKCTFCVHRIEKGLQPACVANCPVFALNFGDLDDPKSEVSRLLKEKRVFRLLEEYSTHPKVYYVGYPPGTKAREFEAVKARA